MLPLASTLQGKTDSAGALTFYIPGITGGISTYEVSALGYASQSFEVNMGSGAASKQTKTVRLKKA